MKLSIITINYNNCAGLEKTSQSILSLNYNDFEWIIIDGGSTDGSKELIESLVEETNLTFWCSEKDNGIYNAMNKGIQHSNGDYLIFMNSGDCFFSSDILNKVFNKGIKADIIYGNALYIFKDHEELRKVPKNITFRYIYEYTIFHQSTFIRKELLENGYDENLKIVADWKMWLVWVLQNKIFYYIDEAICKFDAYGISTGNEENVEKERNKVKSEILPQGIKDLMDEVYLYENIIYYNPMVLKLIGNSHTYKLIFRFVVKMIKMLNRL